MSLEIGVERTAGLGRLRAGAALALVLAAASLTPAIAQSTPETADAAADATTAEEGPLAARAAEGAAAENDDDRDRVYVFGRRVTSSVATVNTEDAPQVINVISAETLAEQGVASLEQALRNVPGITTQIGEGGVMSGDQFFIRGLSAKNDVFTDGLRDFGVYTRDSFNYGQVEVFKGPSAAAFGRGAAGGGINTSSKTPYSETGGAATLSAGDAEYMRFTADWNQDFGNGVAARIAVMAHHNENTGRDHVYSDRWGVAPSIGFGLDGNTTMTIAYLHQDEQKVPDYGIPTVAIGGVGRPVTDFGVDAKTFYGYAADTDDTVVDTVTARLRHTVNDWLQLTSDTRYGVYQRYSQFTPVSCGAAPATGISIACSVALTDGDPATVPLAAVGGPGPYDQDTEGVQNITTATFTAPVGSLRNELLVGFDVSWQHNDRNQYGYVGTRAPKSLLDPALAPNPVVGAARANTRDTTARDAAVFVNDRLWLTDQWSITAGVRAQAYEVDQNTTTFATTVCNGATLPTAQTCYTPISSESNFVTPQVGLIWEPTPAQNYYLSYSTSAKPPGVSTNNGDTLSAANSELDPEKNSNIEFGARLGLFDDRMQLQGAVFRTKKDNAKESDPLGNIVRSGDSQEITGIEIGVGGTITDQWSINANYTFLDTQTTDCAPTAPATVCANIGNQIAFTPESAASLWTTYNFTGLLEGLEVGGGLTYQDDVFLNASNTAIAPGYTTLDGLISYGWDRFRISLNGYNLSDELYFAQVHGNRLTPGQGRTFVATLGVVY